MTNTWVNKIILYSLVGIFTGIAIHAPIIVVGERLLPSLAELIKAWKELLLLFVSILLIIQVSRRRMWTVLLQDWLVRLSLLYILLHIVLAVLVPTPLKETVAGLMIDLRYVALLIVCYTFSFIEPRLRRYILIAVGLGAIVVVGFGGLQATVLPDDILSKIGYSDQTIRPFTTIDRNDDFIRINSTLRGPNPLGAMCVLYIALLTTYLMYRRRQLSRQITIIAGGIAVMIVLFCTYSRSAYGAAVAAIGTAVALVRHSYRPKQTMVVGLVLALIIGGAGIALRSSDWFSNVILHEDPESSVVSKSNDEHVESLIDGARRAAIQPFGAGVGSTGSASIYEGTPGPTIENIYLFIAHESGWIGITLFAAIFILIMKRLFSARRDWAALGLFTSGVGLALIGILLPVWTDETVAMTWWGLVGCVLGSVQTGIMVKDYAARTGNKAATGATSIR